VSGAKGREASQLDPELLERGSKLYLKAADGQDSDDWVLVFSRWADPVRFTLDDTQRRGSREMAAKGKISHQLRGQLIREVHAAMIADWGGPSFEKKKPTQEEKIAWLKLNPQHGEAIDDRCSADRFFMKASDSSSSGSETKSD
jgi:hypothetical protein